MKKIFFIFFPALFLFFILTSPSAVFAVADGNLNDTTKIGVSSFLESAGKAAKFDVAFDESKGPVYRIIFLIIGVLRVALTFTGVFFLAHLVYGGYSWMTAGGNEETLEKAKKTIVNSVIGMGVVILSLIITLAVSRVLIRSTTEGGSFFGVGVDKNGVEGIIE